MLLTMQKSFPWYRETYMAGSVADIDEKTARQFIAAGLGKAAPAGAKANHVTAAVKARPLQAVAQRVKKVITSAPVQKAVGAVGAMMQPEAKTEEQKDAEAEAGLAKQKEVLAKNASGVTPAKK